MLKAINIVKEEGAPITGRQCGSRAIDRQPQFETILTTQKTLFW